MESNVLHNVLSNTFNPNQQIQQQSELDLKQLSSQPGFVVLLLQTVMANQVPHPIRMAAVIYLKNFVHQKWKENNISDQDKQFVKQNILQAIVHAPQQLKIQLCCALHSIIAVEYPVRWSSLVDEILQLMKSNDINSTYASLLCLAELLKTYKYSLEDEHRTIINNLVSRTFGVLADLQKYLLQQDQVGEQGEFFAHMRLIVAKIFWYGMQMGTPVFFFQNPNQFELWMQLFMQSAQKPIAPEKDENSPLWKTNKWISHIAYRLLSMYLHPTIIEVDESNVDATNEFANYFLEKFALPWLSVFVGLLDSHCKNERVIPKRISALALTYMHGVIENQKLFDASLKAQLPYIISNIIFPYLCFNAEDAELWESDPEEYVRHAFEVSEDMYSPKAAAASVIVDLVKVRKNDALPVYLSYINTELNKYNQEQQPQNKNYALKDGIMFSIGSLKNSLKRAKQTKNSLEMMLIAHVYPEFENPRGFLRAKACWILGRFSSIAWSKQENMTAGLRKILNCLNDKELPVKVQAGLALTDFLNNPEALSEVKPILPQLLQVFLQNMNEMEHEKVVESIELLISAFHDEMEPYALSIVQKMAETFLRLFNDDEAGEEAEFVMDGCLRTMITLMGALHNKTHLFPMIEKTLFPVVYKILESPDGMEYISHALELLTNLTYYGSSISKELWQLFPMMGEMFKEYAYDYIYEFVAPIDNFVSKDPDVFLSNPGYLEIVMYMINLFLSDDDAVEKEMQSAVKLASILLQYLRGRIDNVMPKLLELIIGRLSKATTTALKILLIDAVGDALLYNTDFTLQFMESTNCTSSVFGLWLSTIPKFQRLYDRKVTVLALSAIINKEMQTLPSAVQANVGQIITTCVKQLIQMHIQRQQEEKAEQEAERERQEYLQNITNGYAGDDEDDEDDADFQRQIGDDEADGIDITGMQHSKAFKNLIAQLSSSKWDDQADDDELDEEEQFSSGVDNMNEKSLFGMAVKNFSDRYPEPFRQIVSSLDANEQSALKELMSAN